MIRFIGLPRRVVVEDVTEEKDDYICVHIRDVCEDLISPKESLRMNKKLHQISLHEVENYEHV